jgi:hypothetical protein
MTALAATEHRLQTCQQVKGFFSRAGNPSSPVTGEVALDSTYTTFVEGRRPRITPVLRVHKASPLYYQL